MHVEVAAQDHHVCSSGGVTEEQKKIKTLYFSSNDVTLQWRKRLTGQTAAAPTLGPLGEVDKSLCLCSTRREAAEETASTDYDLEFRIRLTLLKSLRE